MEYDAISVLFGIAMGLARELNKASNNGHSLRKRIRGFVQL